MPGACRRGSDPMPNQRTRQLGADRCLGPSPYLADEFREVSALSLHEQYQAVVAQPLVGPLDL